MASSLGIHISGKVLRYAKVTVDNKATTLEKYGVKFIKSSVIDVIKQVVQESKSEDLPIVLGTYDDSYYKMQIFKHLAKADIKKVINLEFEDWCEKKAKEYSEFQYVSYIPEGAVGDYYNGILNVVERKTVDLFKHNKELNVVSMYPAPFVINNLVPKEEKNYILVNLDEKLYITTVVDGKVLDIIVEDIGIKDIIEKLIEFLGSEQKAYEACKKINVFPEGESQNDKAIEEVTEPILQEILRKLSDVVNRRRSSADKILLTGMGTLFTNIDILFREYLDMRTEILKPNFLSDIGGVRNIAEALESTSAISVAYEYLVPTVPNIEQYKKSSTSSILSKFFGEKKKKEPTKKVVKEAKVKNNILQGYDFSKVTTYIISGAIVLGLTFVTYLTFSGIYVGQTNKLKKDLDDKTAKVKTYYQAVNDDIQYVNSNKEKYKQINDEVKKVVEQIENKQINKFNTNNVASFMQNLIKVMPKNINLTKISSDDNKKVTISAKANTYQDLGYFVAQLKLQNILNNVKVNSINNASTIEVEIGGDLP